jgi:plastocyanin
VTRSSMPRSLLVMVGVLALMLFASACGSSKKAVGGGAATSGTSTTTIHVKNFAFDPKTVTVSVGAKLTWVFDDSAKHNVTASDKSFASGDLSSGKTFTYTFNKAGTYNYLCTIHQYMTATVVAR